MKTFTTTNAHHSLLSGFVMHSRLRPQRHAFRYPVFYLRLACGTLAQAQPDTLPASDSWLLGINRWRPLAVHFKDYGQRDGKSPLPWLARTLASHHIQADGEIYLQTMPRIFGYAFNPISLWYCHAADGSLRAVLAEVNNTFGEHHHYLLQLPDRANAANTAESPLQARKCMHVSPFCPLKGTYHFQFDESAASCNVKIDYQDEADTLLHTALQLRKQTLNSKTLLQALLQQPLLTVGVIWRIHWQALLLWCKRIPVFSHQPQPSGGAGSSNLSRNLEHDLLANKENLK